MATNSFRRGLVLALALGFLATPFLWAWAQASNITVFAAASLKNALDDAAKKYEAKTGDKVVVSYAGRSSKARPPTSSSRRSSGRSSLTQHRGIRCLAIRFC
jgi:molybdate transport system substrate-binding protein